MERGRIKSDLIYSLILNAAALIVSVLLYCPFFEENDDAFIAMISEGAFGSRDHHLIYANVVYGKILTALSSLFSGVRWHSVLQYLLIFAAMTLMTLFICRYSGSRLFALLFTAASFYELYVSLQYSKTAAFAASVGFVLLFRQVHEKEKDTAGIISGSVLLTAAALLRDSSFYLAGIFAFVICMTDLAGTVFSSGKRDDKKAGPGAFSDRFLSYVRVFAPVLTIILVLVSVNRWSYEKDEGWKTFTEYNDNRMRLLDYRYDLLDITKHKDSLSKAGISENDALLYLTWQFGDDGILSSEKMEGILETGTMRPVDLSMFKGFAANVYNDFFRLNPLCLFLLFVIVVLISGDFVKRRGLVPAIFVLCLELFVFCGILFYFHYSGRWTHRVAYGAALSLCVMLTGLYVSGCFGEKTVKIKDPDGPDNTKLLIPVLVFLAFADISLLLGNRFDHNAYKREEPDYKAFYGYVADNADTLFVADTFTFQNAYVYDIFTAYPEGFLKNYVTTGSWFVNSPITKEITGRFGYKNPFDALCGDDENVILADNLYPEEKLEFINEHYGEDHYLSEQGEINGIRLYGIHKKPE
ncbi:MAG: hypothetical protein K5886_00110 [Lachnospiraceae bacterium]|nr:hypothetical protein [Lachnospiraceae bacterium]